MLVRDPCPDCGVVQGLRAGLVTNGYDGVAGLLERGCGEAAVAEQ
jgi:hypothetical protein